ncbi:PhnD/SsuA/transferrin family substrate-binding protein [Shewanella insulae]|uniref:sensor histidine kinase n=1 Tax=Shewanella insulae TaxID=2681496 RepID=UPI001EFEE186|nr:sensor histidine kinase [Shewanella insulae]MCG9755449.1 PhnD/SsuA/transferrin family substrate-binding protein [Shewanella insulae]
MKGRLGYWLRSCLRAGWLNLCISGLFVSSLLLFSQFAPAATPETSTDDLIHFRVGVLANHGVQKGIERWQPMMDYLSQEVPGTHFEVVPVDFDEMSRQLLAHELQFIVTNPGQYFNLSSNFPLSWLATMKSHMHGGATFAIGSTIIVRADSQIYTLKDLEGKHLVASDPQALGGYQAAIGLLHKMGYNPENYFGSLRFLGFPLEPIVYQVRDGTVDAAITPFCTLEEMIQDGLVKKEDFRVIHPTMPAGYECLVSTQLYPNWSFAAADTVPPAITQKITQALYALGPDHPAAIQAKTLGWTAPISQLKVIKLFKELQLKAPPPPLHYTVLKWMEKNKEWGLALLLLFLVSTVYHLWLEYKFRQKSDFLIDTERQLKDKALQVERMKSAAILGEIGSGLAHELNQPIAAITQYSEGGMMQLNSRGDADSDLYELLAKINAQSARAGAVVHRIRGLLKRRKSQYEALSLDEVVTNTLALFRREFQQQGIVLTQEVRGEPYSLFGDAVGLSQVLVNLIKNSLDAMAEMKPDREKRLLLSLEYGAQQATLRLVDNGPGLKGKAQDLMASFYSTKDDGLGLGLAICCDVMRQHKGQFTIDNCADHADLPWREGCVVSLSLPRNLGTCYKTS